MKFLFISAYIIHPSTSGAAQLDRALAIELVHQGHKVLFYSAENKNHPLKNQDNYDIICYETPKRKTRIEYHLPDIIKKKTVDEHFEQILIEYKPDIIYVANVINNISLVEIALKHALPIFAICHDYSWFCLKRFLIDEKKEVCKGPDSFTKCYNCLRFSYGAKVRLLDNLSILADLVLPDVNTPYLLRRNVKSLYKRINSIRNSIIIIAQNQDTIDIFNKYTNSKNIFKLSQPTLTNHIKHNIKPNTDTINLAWVGRISYEKGFQIFADSVEMLLTNEIYNFELTIISYGKHEKDIICFFQKKFHNVVNKKLNIIGNLLLPDDVSVELAKVDLLVVTSICPETGPLVILESLASGTPVICNNLHGNRDNIINDVNGYIYNYKHVTELNNKIKELCLNTQIITNWKTKILSVNTNRERTNLFLNQINRYK